MSNSNNEVKARLFDQCSKVMELVREGNRDAEKVSRHLQQIISDNLSDEHTCKACGEEIEEGIQVTPSRAGRNDTTDFRQIGLCRKCWSKWPQTIPNFKLEPIKEHPLDEECMCDVCEFKRSRMNA